jgi:hypothetical protein
MSRKVKHKYDFKLRCVQQVLNHHQTLKDPNSFVMIHPYSLDFLYGSLML